MPGKTKKSKSNEAYFKGYSLKKDKNKENKITKHLIKHPNDKQSEERKGVKSYARKKPLTELEIYLADLNRKK